MTSTHLSSQQAAERIGVSVATIKRWSDAGLLKCARTAGKHRRFEHEEVERFLKKEMNSSSNEHEVNEWLAELLHPQPFALEARLFTLRSKLQSWCEVADSLGPILTKLGEKWADKKISTLEEHCASERFGRVCARIADYVGMANQNAPVALLATAEGDEHTLGLSLLELCLRELGYATIWSGRQTPGNELLRTISKGNLDLLCISASQWSDNADKLLKQALALEEVCNAHHVKLVLGGLGAWPKGTSAITATSFTSLHSCLSSESPKYITQRT